MSQDNKPVCTRCLWFSRFEKREDEPSGMGCKQSAWGGYVIDVYEPPCGGIAFTRIKDTPVPFRESPNA